jgi:hypothetical protein
MVSWLYFEGIDALRKWLEEVISAHEKLGHREEVEEYSRVMNIANEFSSYIYSRKCFGYMLVICDHVELIAMCKEGELIQPVDVEEWLEYADL